MTIITTLAASWLIVAAISAIWLIVMVLLVHRLGWRLKTGTKAMEAPKPYGSHAEWKR